MEQMDSSRRGKHLTRQERMVIERMSRGGPATASTRLATSKGLASSAT